MHFNIILLKGKNDMSLKDLVKEKGYTNYFLGAASDVPNQSIGAMLNGKRDPLNMTLDNAYKLSKVLGVTLDDFFKAVIDDSYEDTAFVEGWNIVNKNFSVLVIDGRVFKAVEKQEDSKKEMYLYKLKEDGWDLMSSGVGLNTYRNLMKSGKLRWM